VPDINTHDAVLVVSFGGPEGPDEVMPFLENVVRGRNVPPDRLKDVASHYEHFGGKSPINDQNRALIAALGEELRQHGLDLPIYWGNRNWHPLLADTILQMRDDGVRRALAFVTAAYASYSSCRQYLDDIAAARASVGAESGSGAPSIDKLRLFYNHPGFIQANADNLRAALVRLAPGQSGQSVAVAFTAHSIPMAMASQCDYVAQLSETAGLVAEAAGLNLEWQLVYQSRSGPPTQPWLEPDIADHLRALRADGVEQVVIAPIGFVSDHMEVVHDLDVEADCLARSLGLEMVRAATVGTSPAFVTMIRQLIEERLDPSAPRLAVGRFGPWPDVCPPDCCPAPRRA
jgi:ferrochelatase